MSQDPAATTFTAAIASFQRGGFGEAERLFGEALQLNPEWPEAAYNRGLMLVQLNRIDEALTCLNRALELRPAYPAALSTRAGIWAARGQPDRALADYVAALTVQPAHLESLNNSAALYRQLGRFDEALNRYDQAITASPDTPLLHYNRGVVLAELKRPDEAIAAYQRALSLDGRYSEAHYNLGVLLAELNRFEEALNHYEQALAINPSDLRIMNNRGAVLLSLQRHEDALLCLNLLLAVKPDFVEALNNKAAVLRELGRIDEAIAAVDRALAIDPGTLESNWHRSMLYLLCGDLPNGFRLYERRWERGDDAPRRIQSDRPVWLGQLDPKGWSILVFGEQGLGDQIQFVRYVTLLAERGAEVHLQVDRPLVHLLRSVRGLKSIGVLGDPPPKTDFQCPMMSLPFAFGTTIESVPAAAPYLSVSSGRLAYWAEKLGSKTKPRVGVMWSGGTRAKLRNRSIPLTEFSMLFTDNIEWISLQKDIRDTDRAALGELKNLRHFGCEQDDFTDTAALCELVDLVITIDTVTAHLAGALARPTWVLLPFAADWRWMLEGAESPWHRTVKLWRQRTSGAWSETLREVKEQISASVPFH